MTKDANTRQSIVPIILRRMRPPLVVLISAYAIAVLGFTLMPGMDDQGNPWRMSFFEAFYVVSYTGSTIGFGEVPYDFSPAQRLWTIVSIYLTVFAWLYSVGTIISLLQDPGFRQELTRAQLHRSLRNFRDPFYIICGYGDTGRLLSRYILGRGGRVVVVDSDPEHIELLRATDMGIAVPAFCMDAEIPSNLIRAGLQLPLCQGVLAVTDSNHVNLKIAISVKLLNKKTSVFCRAGSEENANNMLSFGTDLVVRPDQDFAHRLRLGMREPDTHRVYDWLTSLPNSTLPERPVPPRGPWIICGFSQFGQAVYHMLQGEGVDTRVVCLSPQSNGAPEDAITGKGTEAVTLKEAGIYNAEAIVAGTTDDADNLSIIMTARQLNPNIYVVCLENKLHNRPLFKATHPDLPVQYSYLVASRFLSVMGAPMLKEFLQLAAAQDNSWNKTLVQKMEGFCATRTPESWNVDLSQSRTPAIITTFQAGHSVRLGNLCRSPARRKNKLPVVALLLRRDHEDVLLPDDDTALQPGDRLLFCGTDTGRKQLNRNLLHFNSLRYVQTGELRPDGIIWRYLDSRRRAKRSST